MRRPRILVQLAAERIIGISINLGDSFSLRLLSLLIFLVHNVCLFYHPVLDVAQLFECNLHFGHEIELTLLRESHCEINRAPLCFGLALLQESR